MKPRKEIYQKITEQLQALVTAGTLKYVDLNKGQLDNAEKGYPISFPAVLIQTDAIRYTHKSDNRVKGEATVTLSVALHHHHNSFMGSASKQASEDTIDLLDTIVEALTYTRGESFTDMELSDEQFLPYTFKGLHIHQIRYTCLTYHKIKEDATVRITRGA